MKMGDPLLSIYLLFLSCTLQFLPACSTPPLSLCVSFSHSVQVSHCPLCFHCSFVLHYSNPRASMLGPRTATQFPCQTCLCLPFCPCVFSLSSLLWRLQIGGCKMTNVIGAAFGLGFISKNSHPSLWLKNWITAVDIEHPCLAWSLYICTVLA